MAQLAPPAVRASTAAPSRRAMLAGAGAGVALAAIAGSSALYATQRRGASSSTGKLVPDLLRTEPFYVAHRGGGADWPEMSMEGYRQSVAHGANALEISLARSSDGVWFGLHDATLDRTSGTSGFVVAQHRWAEISRYRITAQGTRYPGQDPQPYLRFEDLIAVYAETHTIFVDPKVVDPRYYSELLQMIASVRRPTDSFIAKSYCTGTGWAQAARAHGLRTWGYYYGAQIDDGTTPPAADPGTMGPARSGRRSLRRGLVEHPFPRQEGGRPHRGRPRVGPARCRQRRSGTHGLRRARRPRPSTSGGQEFRTGTTEMNGRVACQTSRRHGAQMTSRSNCSGSLTSDQRSLGWRGASCE